MPCKPRMTGCAASCLHRRMVNDYRLARTAYEDQLEAENWETERAEYAAQNPGITFKEWLIGHRKQRQEGVAA
jgi:hypothetical protein